MRGVSNRPRQLPDAHLLGGEVEALEVALHFGVPVRQLQSECNRLGMDTMSAANLWGMSEFLCPALEHLDQLLDIRPQDRGCLLYQERLRRIDDIVRREPIVEPSRLRPDLFRHCRCKSDDVVLYLGLDLIDAVEIEIALGPNGLGSRL